MTQFLDIDLRAEVSRLQSELTLFRDECLPALLGAPIQECFDERIRMSDQLKAHRVVMACTLSSWRQAAARLGECVPLGPLPSGTSPFDREDFREFLFQRASPAFDTVDGRIVWRVELLVSLQVAVCYSPFRENAGDDWHTWDWFLGRLDDVKRWLMGLPVDSPELWNGLCMVLPLVAEVSPPFAKLALDRESWKALARADRGIDEPERARLEFADHFWFSHVLNNALVHVLGCLANNHFLLICEYLDHECLRGSYTHLMPHYLFAVLIEKVSVLRRLSQVRPELWSR